ncbi:TfoX/Sxy family protein [Agromyces endophyticus]|uniref:TfoX/Sxy family protein n=1 Tax=Agromyces sp. H17E-10 TaxID=2932244 RepID=UPI001FD4AAD4|nr:TfoX/Sxy family protein [Agromyces sp. H17E-10]UOQ90100.1 TfoX/Sxy family protein [Agromyces sp. H17E-10]
MGTRDEGFELLEQVATELLAEPDVGFGRMFGSEGLSVRGKFFAFVSSQGDLVVKLAEDRIAEAGLDNMVMRGRPMREWAVVPVAEGVDRWRTVAREAYAFVDSITPS